MTDVLDDISSLVYSFIYKAAPEPITKEELTEQSGLETDELRTAIAELEKRHMITGEAEGYRCADGILAEDKSEPHPDAGKEEAEQPTTEMAQLDSTPPGPAAGKQVRVHLSLLSSYAAAPRETDDAATTKAQAIATEVGNVLAAAMPNLNFHVEVTRIDAFDEPRQVWPPPEEDSNA